jgi:hypothetical protein
MEFLRTYEAWLIGKGAFRQPDADRKRTQLEALCRVRLDADLARLPMGAVRRFRQARKEYSEWCRGEDPNLPHAFGRNGPWEQVLSQGREARGRGHSASRNASRNSSTSRSRRSISTRVRGTRPS